jgi:translation initiation factor eIF-2B subunit alpha
MTRQETTEDPLVLQDLRRFLANKQQDPPSLFDTSAMAVPVAAISALLGVVERSQAETMMGLQDELKQAADCMIQNHPQVIAVRSGCELFLRYSTRTFLELPNFSECKKQILERGERFQMISLAARDRIARAAADFIPAGATVLTTGWSRVVAAILREAKHPFDLIVLEGRPDASGAKAAACYARESNIPVKVILDSAVAYFMDKVDLVLVGAEGVLENGGVVNKLGTATMAMCAKASGKPFYVAAESYKFARLYPLHQSDVPVNHQTVQCVDTTTMQTIEWDEKITADNPSSDFTPAKYISLLFTDLGVLTPSAVSDELIRLYQ